MTAYALFNEDGDCTAVVGAKVLGRDCVPVADAMIPDNLWRAPDGDVVIRQDYTGLPETVPVGFIWEALGVDQARAFVDRQPITFPFIFDQRGQYVVEVKGRYRMLCFVTAQTYADDRAAAYPSIEDQLDQLFHEGLDAWRATIAAVKEQFPKVQQAGE